LVASSGVTPPRFQALLHRLDHDDRVVDHDADGEHQAEERERVDREVERRKGGERAMSEIGTARIGISVARQLCRKRNTTSVTSTKAMKSVFTTSFSDSVTNGVVV